MFEKILKSIGLVRRSEGAGATSDFWYSFTGNNFESISDEKAINQGYNGNDIVYSIINKVARLVGGLPITLIKGDEAIYQGDTYNKLIKRVNPRQGLSALWQELTVYLLTTGDGYIWRPKEIIGFAAKNTWVLPSQLVTPFVQANQSILDEPLYYQFDDSGKSFRIDPSEITHIQMFNPSTSGQRLRDGLSPLQPAGKLLDSSNNLQNAESNIFMNGGANKLISGASGQDLMTKSDKENLDNALIQRRGGSGGFNKALTVQGAISVHDIGLSPNDLKLFDAHLTHLRKFCNIIGIDSGIFNDPANKTYANRKEAEKALYTDLILPIAREIINAYEISILPDFANHYLNIDTTEIEALNESPTEKSKRYMEAVKAGILAPDDWRMLEGFEPLGGEFAVPKAIKNETQQTGINPTEGNSN